MGKIPGKITGLTLKHLFKKPATIAYPEGKLEIAPDYHGKITYDHTNCIGCRLCMKDCPAGAIRILEEVVDGEKFFQCQLNYGRCLFCGQCVESCKKGCLSFVNQIELGCLTKEELTKIME